MPRVYKIDDDKWKELFKYDCDCLRFRFNPNRKSEYPYRHARRARDFVQKIRKAQEQQQNESNESNVSQKVEWDQWQKRFSISFSAAYTSLSQRVKQSSVTTVIEVIEYFNHALQTTSNKSFLCLPRKIQQEFIEVVIGRIGRLVYYYAAAYAAMPLLNATGWKEVPALHRKEIKKFATDQFYLVKCHASDLIAERLLEANLPDYMLEEALFYTSENDRQIPPKDRANLRRWIASLIAEIPKEELAFEAAYFIIDNASYEVREKIYIPGYHPPKDHTAPEKGCHRFTRLPINHSN